MRLLGICLVSMQLAAWGAPAGHSWEAVRGRLTPDNAVTRQNRASLRLEPAGDSDACARSEPLRLTAGRQYELSGWVRTEKLEARDLDRTPIATGAALAMESMPFDVHSEAVASTRDWTRLALRFTATRSEDRILLLAGAGGAFRGKAWFEGVSLEEAPGAAAWPSRAAVKTFGPAYRYPIAGWIYLHIEGEPYERGYQHGWLMAREIERYLDRCASQLDSQSRRRAWEQGRTAANAMFLRGFDQEILQEMKGIADGAAAAGAKHDERPVDLADILVANTMDDLGTLRSAAHVTPSGLEMLKLVRPPYFDPKRDVPAGERCSAFAATGKAARDGRMVIAHITMWSLTLAEQTNILLDIQPVKGHRVLIQSFPGGIQSGTDWYQNDAGVVLTETTIRQGPFNIEGTPVGYRARRAIQYGDNIDKVVEHLATKNNGLYANEWLIGDSRTNEIAMFELGTYKTRLYRSSKNDWFGGAEGFYWGCNNAKDLQVRLEYAPDPKGTPEHLPFYPSLRDIKWQDLYEEYKGRIDEQFAFLAFRTPPLVNASSMDAKVTTAEMASRLMMWAVFGKPNQREWVAPPWAKQQYAGNMGLYSSGYRLIEGQASDSLRVIVAENEKVRLAGKGAQPPARPAAPAEAASGQPAGAGRGFPRPEIAGAYKDRLWKGWILPASDADIWLSAGSAAYYRALSGADLEKRLEEFRADYRAAALEHDQPLARLRFDFRSDTWFRIAQAKGALALDALRRELGDDQFFAMMRDFFEANTTKSVTTAQFLAAAGEKGRPVIEKWLSGPGLPDSGLPDQKPVPIYRASVMLRRAGSAVIVYGTVAEAGANRYAAEQLQGRLLDSFESAAPVRKDFEVSEEELRSKEVVFIGRPETNSALAAWAKRIGLEYEQAAFRIDGRDHASENEALMFVAANPLDQRHAVLVMAGNSPLETVRLAGMWPPPASQYAVFDAGRETSSGFQK